MHKTPLSRSFPSLCSKSSSNKAEIEFKFKTTPESDTNTEFKLKSNYSVINSPHLNKSNDNEEEDGKIHDELINKTVIESNILNEYNSTKTTCSNTNDLESIKSFINKLKMLENSNQLESLLSPRITFRKLKHNLYQEQNSKTTNEAKHSDNMDINVSNKISYYNYQDAKDRFLNSTTNTQSPKNLNLFSNSSNHSHTLDKNDPLRVIKITEIIEINNNNENCSNSDSLSCLNDSQYFNLKLNIDNFLKSKNHENSTYSVTDLKESTSNFSSCSHVSSSHITVQPKAQLNGHNFYHQNKPKIKLSSPNIGYRQLPILIEKINQTQPEDYENPPLKTTKCEQDILSDKPVNSNAEIVLEIIKNDEKSTKDNSSRQINVTHIDKSSHSLVDNTENKPKKITIKITGRTRSTSSEAKHLTDQIPLKPSIKSSFSPIIKPLNSNTLTNSFHGFTENPFTQNFTPILIKDSKLCKPNLISHQLKKNNNDWTNGPVQNQNEEIFNLDKFKSYLSTFNEANSASNNRSCSMPPKINNLSRGINLPRRETLIKSANVNENDQDFYGFNSIDEYGPYNQNTLIRRKKQSGEDLVKRTAFNSVKNSIFTKDTNKVADFSDNDEPVWTHRSDLDKSTASLNDTSKRSTNKKSILHKHDVVSSDSPSFRCGFFNIPSKTHKSPISKRKNESISGKNSTLPLSNNYSADSIASLSSSYQQNAKNSSCSQTILSQTKRIQDLKFNAKTLKLPSRNHGGLKKISSYYNEFYSNRKNDFLGKNFDDKVVSSSNTSKCIDEEDFDCNEDYTCQDEDFNEDFEDADLKMGVDNDDTEADEDLECYDTEIPSIESNLTTESESSNQNVRMIPNSKIFSTFLPIKDQKNFEENSNSFKIKPIVSLNSRTPKLARRVNFADECN